MDRGIRTCQDMWRHGLGRFNSPYEGMAPDDVTCKLLQHSSGNFLAICYRMDDGSLWSEATDNFYQNHHILPGT